MSQQNKGPIRRLIKEVEKGDVDMIDELLAPDFVDRSLLARQQPDREGYKHGLSKEPIRDEVLMDLVDLARTDPVFKRKARADLEGALNEYGYELTGDELAAVKEFHRRTRGMSDEEFNLTLAGPAHDYTMRGG